MNDASAGTVTAEELADAMTRHGIGHDVCEYRPCGHVAVVFGSMDDATSLILRGVEEGGPGSLEDRASSGALTLGELLKDPAVDPETDPRALEAYSTGWSWVALPTFGRRRLGHGRRTVGWTVTLDLPVADAAELTAALNRRAQEQQDNVVPLRVVGRNLR